MFFNLCARTKKILRKSCLNVWREQKKVVPLHRYPENNLFTLKRTNTY